MLRSGPGQTVFAGQQLQQTLEKPDIFLNKVAFKTLGLIPGTAVQEGRWRALDGNRYVVRFFISRGFATRACTALAAALLQFQ